MIDKILTQMERDVAEAKAAYIKARDARDFSLHRKWAIYARLLHAYRKEVRKHG